MGAVTEFLHHLPYEVRRVGGSLPWRIGLLALALVANIGFYLPSVPGPSGIPGLDKAAHLLLFAATVFTAGRLLAPRRRFPIGWVVVVALVHAVLIELIQLLVLPQRAFEGADILFDVVGIALGVALWAGERVFRRAAALHEVEPVDEEPMEPMEPPQR